MTISKCETQTQTLRDTLQKAVYENPSPNRSDKSNNVKKQIRSTKQGVEIPTPHKETNPAILAAGGKSHLRSQIGHGGADSASVV